MSRLSTSPARDAVLRAVDAAMAGVACPPAPSSLRTAPVADIPAAWEALQRKLESVGAVVHRAVSPDDVTAALRTVAEPLSGTFIRWEHPLLERLGLDSALTAQGLAPHRASETAAGTPHGFADAALGVTAVDAALVESGSLVVRALPGRPRHTSLLPPVHLAFVTADDLFGGIADIAAVLRTEDGRLPSAVHVISGPSSTGDIELVLVRGAHGPVALHVVFLEYEA